MKALTIPLILLLGLTGCGTIACIDHQFERDPVPISEPYVVTLEFADRAPVSRTVHCEHYYDSMCAERGNYWSIREVGKRTQYDTSEFRIEDEVFGEVLVPLPACSAVIQDREISLENIVLKVNGRPMWLRASDGDLRTYQTAAFAGEAPEQIQLRLMISVDGEDLSPRGQQARQ